MRPELRPSSEASSFFCPSLSQGLIILPSQETLWGIWVWEWGAFLMLLETSKIIRASCASLLPSPAHPVSSALGLGGQCGPQGAPLSGSVLAPLEPTQL